MLTQGCPAKEWTGVACLSYLRNHYIYYEFMIKGCWGRVTVCLYALCHALCQSSIWQV
jgi:hypothetical protein